MGDRTLNKYDAMIIFESSMSEEGLQKALGRVKEEITKLGGTTGEAKIMGKRIFARPMKKKNDGVYIKMPCEMESQAVAKLKARLKLNDDVFRLQITCASKIVKAAPQPEEAGARKDG